MVELAEFLRGIRVEVEARPYAVAAAVVIQDAIEGAFPDVTTFVYRDSVALALERLHARAMIADRALAALRKLDAEIDTPPGYYEQEEDRDREAAVRAEVTAVLLEAAK